VSKNQQPPSPSRFKARRRRTPVFADEPIQWHLSNTKKDTCPWCGLAEMAYFSKTHRSCMKCDVAVDLTMTFPSGKKWYEAKLNGHRTAYGDSSDLYKPFVPEDAYEPYNLATAQRASANGRACLHVKHGYRNTVVRWHSNGLVPEFEDGSRMVAPGSPFWYWIVEAKTLKLWVPDEPLNAMEILARATTDDPVFAIMMT
jgi:hypothetical protein